MANNVNPAALTTPAQRASVDRGARVEAYVESLPKMRPDFYNSTLERFKGDHDRWTKWAAGYMQFFWNQMLAMIEQAGKK